MKFRHKPFNERGYVMFENLVEVIDFTVDKYLGSKFVENLWTGRNLGTTAMGTREATGTPESVQVSRLTGAALIALCMQRDIDDFRATKDSSTFPSITLTSTHTFIIFAWHLEKLKKSVCRNCIYINFFLFNIAKTAG